MATLYFIGLIPLFIGAFFWVRSREIVMWEWLAATGVGLITVVIMHLVIYHSMVADEVTLSGQITKTTYHPEWTEKYYVTVCHTVGSGKNARQSCHQESRIRYHSEYWDTDTNLGFSKNINENFYNQIVNNFGRIKEAQDDSRYGRIAGDPNIYVTYNKTGFVYPVTSHKYWENPIKASKSLFKYSEPTPAIKKQLFKYPENSNWLQSDRLLGLAKQDFNLLEFDRANAYLGPRKKVNLIIIGFGPNATEEVAEYQKALWGGGKENDLIITYGGPKDSKWVHVFGWTEKDIVKINLESLLLSNDINTKILPSIKTEVVSNYQLKDWSKFNYLSIEPPGWAWIVVLFIVCIVQIPCWMAFLNNEYSK